MSRLPSAVALASAIACVAALLAPAAVGSSLPPGFQDTSVASDLEEPTTLRFAPDGRIFVATKAGKILVYDDLDALEGSDDTVFADLRTYVYDSGDRGLLGLALDPDFDQGRPYVYALYTYDHVLGEAGPAPKWGKVDDTGDDCPKPEDADVDACPVSGRLVRLTASGDHALEAGGQPVQKVLVEDWCQQFSSHSIGDLAFDASGALLASGGDGASFYDTDFGQFGWPVRNQCDDPPAGIGGLQVVPAAEGGALRSQDARTPEGPGGEDPTSLDGSLIRVDPDSGEAVPGNPYYASPDRNLARIVAYGFRNPFRFTLDPESGEAYVANVGWNSSEEIDRFPLLGTTAFDSGWPCYEGPWPNALYEGLGLDLCESVYDDPSVGAPPFFHYWHNEPVVPGDDCASEAGSAVSGLALYKDGPFPASYDGALFFADPIRGCIYAMLPDEDGDPDPLETVPFLTEGGEYPGVDLEIGPEGDLYYVSVFSFAEGGSIHRISYDPTAPVARLTAGPRWGKTPLKVTLDASGSSEPGGKALSYEWDLDGNGSFETDAGATVEHTYSADANVKVGVRVSNAAQASIAQLTLYPGDTPPQPTIDAPDTSLTWGVGQDVFFHGSADDAEDGEVDWSGLYWRARLFHCPAGCHAHPLQAFPGVDEGVFAAPDHDYPAHIEITLTATDSRGLSATESVSVYPRTVDLAIASDPPGVALGAGLRSEPAPFTLRAIEGSHVVLSAPPTAEIDDGEYEWTGWSDGGARVHTVEADSDAAYTASYRWVSGSPPGGPGQPGEAPPTQAEAAGSPGEGSIAGTRPAKARLGAHPAKRTRSRAARFTFVAGGAVDGLRCKLDRRPFRPCRSPLVYRHLRPGRHRLTVVVVGAGEESAPVGFSWEVLARR